MNDETRTFAQQHGLLTRKGHPKYAWIRFQDLPDDIKPLALAYSKYYDALYHTNNVIKYFSISPNLVLIIQHNGRICPERLLALQAGADCLVEVEAVAPGYYEVMLFGHEKPGNRPESGMWGYDGIPDGVRCRWTRR